MGQYDPFLITYLMRYFMMSYLLNYSRTVLGSRFLAVVVISMALLRVVSIASYLPLPQNWFFADVTKIDILNLLNKDRQAMGLPLLKENKELDNAAFLKAQDMVAHEYFSHESPQGVSPWFWFLQAGYRYKYAGENLAVGFSDSKNTYEAWLNSPSHRDNLFNKNYTDMGMAVVPGFGKNNTSVVVQLFGSPLKPSLLGGSTNPVTPAKVEPKAAEPIPVPENKGQTVVQAEPSNEQEKVLAGSEEFSFASDEGNAQNNFYLRFLNQFFYNGQYYLNYLMWVLLAGIVSFGFAGGLFGRNKALRRDFVLRSVVLGGILAVSLLINQDIIAYLLSYQVSVQ